MFTRVMEDGPCATWRPLRKDGVHRASSLILAVGSVLCFASPALAQTGGGTVAFRAFVLDLSGQSQSIAVSINRSLTVETTVEVVRADVIARHVADVQVISPRRLLITGQSYGNTSVILQSASGEQFTIDVSVELDLEQLRNTVKTIDPQAQVNVESVRGHIVLTGWVSSLERARRIEEVAALFLPAAGGKSETGVQNHLDVAGEQQVLLRCVVAEVSRTASRELGIDGFLAGENFKDGFLVNQIGGVNPINIGAAANALVTENIPFLTGPEGIPIVGDATLSLGFPRVQMQLFIKAMADNALLTILAEPNLVAISGETATFLSGGEFPYPVPQGNDRVTIEFREFGVRLNFTPVVLGHQRIRLRIAPEVSELDFTTATSVGGFLVPGLRTRATETTVEMGSGQTIAIAGLLSEEIRGIVQRVPGLGDLPVLGALFRSVNYQRHLSELVILVTPEIVAPLDAHQQVSLPGQDHMRPNDNELYSLGLLDGGLMDQARSSDGSQARVPLLPSQPHELSVHGPWGRTGFVASR